MEHKFNTTTHGLDLQTLFEFCEQEGEIVCYKKGEQLECEGKPSQWFAFVIEGCFKYVIHGINDGKEHITWFSFESEFVSDYPSCLSGRNAQTTIEAMVPSRIIRVSGEQLMQLFRHNSQMMELRSLIAEHLLTQSRVHFLDFYRATPRERYELLLHRCPGIVEHLPLKAIASFLNVTPQQLSRIRKDITYENKK
ncbi:MAG: Crp/Fnr family transcriptional regulator [Prevotella sp.]|nr:Crp/Fnr family transcriptional regulator [Prevotella sp.]